MILGFSTQLNGKPTYFVEKILRGIINEHSHKGLGLADYIYQSGEALKYQNVDDIFSVIESKVKPKLHTIREDKNDRWKPGTKIDFFINCRQPSMFRFAPVLPVVSVQKISIFWVSDGFDSVEDFFRYFDKDFKGKIIHWTDLKY